jgi:hypothetical protein
LLCVTCPAVFTSVYNGGNSRATARMMNRVLEKPNFREASLKDPHGNDRLPGRREFGLRQGQAQRFGSLLSNKPTFFEFYE